MIRIVGFCFALVLLFGVGNIALAYENMKPISEVTDPNPLHLKENRHFAAIPTVEVTGNRVWAAWMSGGDTEPHEDNYIVMAYSEDDGVTFTEYMIVDPTAKVGRSCNPVFWQDPSGRLWLFWLTSGITAGTYAMYTEQPTAAAQEIVWTKPKRISRYVSMNKPISIQKDGQETWLLCVQNTEYFDRGLVLSSEDQGSHWQVNRKYAESNSKNKWWLESMMVEKLDGTLWMFSRTEKGYAGGIEQAFSYDQAESWTDFEGDLAHPLQGPGSRFNIYRLQSGNLVWVSNDSIISRSKMTIWLSEDDGATWPYKLLLDERNAVSYPDIAQAEDGTIYVVYDKGRSTAQEICLARFTEEDIKAGAFVTENAKERIFVTKTGSE